MAWVEIPAPADLVQDRAGNVLEGVAVTAKLAGTATNVTHASSITGSSPTTGGLVTRADGTIGTAAQRRYVQSGQALDITVNEIIRRVEVVAAADIGAGPVLVVAGEGAGLGLTDDANLQTALNAYAYQRPVRFQGTMDLRAEVLCPSGTDLSGMSGAKLLAHSSTTGSMLSNADAVEGNNDISLHDFEVDGNKANRVSTGPLIAMKITGGTAGKKLENVHCWHLKVHDGDELGIQYASVQGGSIRHCRSWAHDRDGITLYYDCQDIDIHHNRVWDVKDDCIGLNAENGTTTGHVMNGIHVHHNHLRQHASATAGAGVACHGLQESTVDHNRIYQTYSAGVSVANWNTTPSRDLTIAHNRIFDAGFSATGSQGAGIAVVGARSVSSLNGKAGCQRITIVYNKVRGSRYYGIRLLTQTDGLVERITVDGNEVSNSAKGVAGVEGIYADGVDNTYIRNNQAWDDQGTKTQAYGVAVVNCTGALEVVNNECNGNLTNRFRFVNTAGLTWLKVRDNPGYSPHAGQQATATGAWTSVTQQGVTFWRKDVVITYGVALPTSKVAQPVLTPQNTGYTAIAHTNSNTGFTIRVQGPPGGTDPGDAVNVTVGWYAELAGT